MARRKQSLLGQLIGAVKAALEGAKPRRAPRRATRRNLDAYVDLEGRIRPIRGSEGYDDWRLATVPAHLERGSKAALREAYESWHEEEDDWAAEVNRAIRSVGRGIAPHAGKAEGWEYRHNVPIHLRNRKGIPGDELAEILAREKPWLGIQSEDDLHQALAAGTRDRRRNPGARRKRPPAAFRRWMARGKRGADGKPLRKGRKSR